MSAITRDTGEGERCEAARDNPSNRANSARRRVYPLLMIDGVYRMSFAMGLAVYALPACSASISRHRARVRVRRARQAFQQTITQSSADTCPRHDEPRREQP